MRINLKGAGQYQRPGRTTDLGAKGNERQLLFWNTDNLPVGTHFTGRFGDEATLFRLAAQLEEARPWADRRPPVSASEEA